MSWHLNPRQLEVFRALMLTGSTIRAARALHISQPAVSRALSELEGRIGVALFLRQSGRLHPTPQAHWLFEQSEDTLARFDRLDALLRDLPRTPERALRIVANSAMAHSILPAAMADFRQVAPDVRISLQIVVRRDNRRWINDQDFDLAATMLPIDYPAEAIRPLVTVPAVCILPAAHPLAARPRIEAAMLAGETLVALNHESLSRYRIDRLIEKLDLRTRVGIETQTGSSMCACVAAGLGLAITDPFTAQHYLSQGLAVRPFSPLIDYDYGVLYPLRPPRSPMAEAFVPLMVAAIRRVAHDYQAEFPGWLDDVTFR